MKRTVAALLLVGVLAGCTGATAPATPEAFMFTFERSHDASRMRGADPGLGALETSAFALSGGSYSVSWVAQAYLQQDCSHRIALAPASGAGGDRPLVQVMVRASTTDAGTALASDVAAGSYYFRVDSDCGWHVSIKRA